jgi:CorA-like Mg2+ transporter protein
MSQASLLPSNWKVPQVFRDRLGNKVGRQRVMFADGHLLLALHAPPKPDERHRQGRFFWRSPDGTWKSSSFGDGIKALDRHLEQYLQELHKLESAEDRATTADDYFPIMQAIAPLHRSAGNMHNTLQQARELVGDDRDLIVCRDHAYIIERSIELLQNDTKNGLDCVVARRAEEDVENSRRMAAAAHRLNVMAAIFFPIATLATIFGMNLRSGLENVGPVLFWVVLLVGVLVGAVVKESIVGGSRDKQSDHRKLPEGPRVD